ncbi:2-oxoacid:acceptor oxidoreductase family protein [Patescibacteria group bacterium]|nr:2-oxoacid:acceptor oxidoreductase family protein [Patescibacteria group bacterium]
MNKVWTVKIAGPAGTGIKSAGLLLAQILNESGYCLKDYSEYPSLVRGGHNTYQVSFSKDEVFCAHKMIDIFVSLVPGHWQEHKDEFTKDTLVFSDSDGKIDIPLKDMCQQMGASIYGNTISLGLISYLLDLDEAKAKKIIVKHFGEESVNINAYESGRAWAEKNCKKLPVEKGENKDKKIIVDGNEATGWGFYKAGLEMFVAYPMTPATGVLHFLAKNQDKFKMKVVHPEDEIAVASIASGASMAGVRSAVATSGGGFALMTETISFDAMAELGVVYFLSQRPGPATGMPTWTSQGDMLFAVHSGHGEFPKVVLAPGDQEEAFEMAKVGLNLANEFDIPVIILSDKNLSESSANVKDFEKEEKEIVESNKAVPGKKMTMKLYNSYEHDEEGFSVEDAIEAKKQIERRLKKGERILKKMPKVNLFGSDKAKKIIVSWGSSKGAILEALKEMKNKEDYAFLQIRGLWPIDPRIGQIISAFKERILVENNATAQLEQLLKSQMNISFDKKILKFDGRPFFPEELREELK